MAKNKKVVEPERHTCMKCGRKRKVEFMQLVLRYANDKSLWACKKCHK